MASLISLKTREDKKVAAEILMDDAEFLQLRGHISDLCVFSMRTVDVDTNLALKGRNSATKYFLVPKVLRKNLSVEGRVTCQKLEGPGAVVFVYVIDKLSPAKK